MAMLDKRFAVVIDEAAKRDSSWTAAFRIAQAPSNR